MIHILIEENYSDNNRFHRLFEGISSVVRKKHEDVKVCGRIEELPASCRVVILVCQSLKWSVERVAALNERGIHPLVFGFPYLDTLYDYSSIAPNYTKAAFRLTRYMLSRNAGKTAVVGYNEDSLPDRLKLTGIRYAAEEMGQSTVIFANNGDVEVCLKHFSQECEDVKNVVCCNDNVAILLHCRYPHLLEGRRMGSCSGLKLSEFFAEPYPVCRSDYFAAGVQLASLYLMLAKAETLCSTVMTFDMQFSCEGEEAFYHPKGAQSYSRAAVDFYGDKSLERMERLDRMLTDCDETDLSILAEVARGITYSEIADSRYLAVNTVKYRIKKMMETVGVDSRRELQALIDEYKVTFEKS